MTFASGRTNSARAAILPAATLLATVLLTTILAGPVPAQQAVPALTGRVVDEAGILSAATRQTLSTLLSAHEAATTNQVAVLTVSSLDGETIEAFSLRVAEAWGLGTAENDNGVLLTVAVADRKMRIEVGYGLEGPLPDAVAGRIIRNEIAPHFRQGDYDAGVLAGVQSILGAIEGTYTPAEDDPWQGEKPPLWFGLIFLIVPSIFLFFGIFSTGCARWFLFLFLIPFFAVSGFTMTGAPWGVVAILVLYVAVFLGSSLHPKVRAIREKVREAQKTGKSVKVGPFTVSTSGSSGGGGWSSGGSSFSGGGGSFGGGGASGGW